MSSNPYCPICKELAVTVAQEIRWCEACGTLIHPTGRAWFCSGHHTAPHLVNLIRERTETLDDPGTLSAIRYRCGLGQEREKVG